MPTALKSGSLKLMEPSGPVQGWFYLLSMLYVSVESIPFCTSIIFVIKTTLFLDVTWYCLVDGFQSNVGAYLPNYVVSHPRALRCLAHFLPCHYSTTCENKASSWFNPWMKQLKKKKTALSNLLNSVRCADEDSSLLGCDSVMLGE